MDPRAIPPADHPARLDALEAAVRARSDLVPEVGIVLGSGLGGLADELEDAVAIPFAELPGWPAATAPGHVGRLLLGTLAGRPVVMLQGRFHLYEGNAPGLVVQPVLLFRRLGARIVVLTNAAGGLDPAFGPGTLMVISDHLNLTGQNPLIGPNADDIGERFTDLTDAWSPRLRARSTPRGRAEGVALAEGIYVGLTGPNYETPAEVRMYAALGGHAVGMSTVMECIAARWAGLEVCGVSLVTNAGAGYSGEPLTHEEVLAAGAEAGPRLARVIRRFVADLVDAPPARDRDARRSRSSRAEARSGMQRSLMAALGATVVILAACGTATSSTPPAEPTVGTSLPATAPPGAPAVTTPPATPATPATPAATAVPRPAGTLAWPTGFAVEMANATYFTSPPFVVPLTITIAEPGWHAGHLNAVFIDLQRYDGVEVGGLPTRMLAFGWPENVRVPTAPCRLPA